MLISEGLSAQTLEALVKHVAFYPSVLLFSLALCACVTTKPPAEPQKAPIVREAGKPLTLTILAAQYTLAPRFEVDDHQDNPGSFLFSFADRVTRCEGFFLFETVSQPAAHEQYVRNKSATFLADWKSLGLAVSERREPLELLGHQCRSALFDIKGIDGLVRSALIDCHLADQNLSIVSFAFCADPALMTGQLAAVVEVINSQKQETAVGGQQSVPPPAPEPQPSTTKMTD